MVNKTSGRCIVAAEVLLLLLTILCGDIMNVWIRSGLLLMLSGVGVVLCFCRQEPTKAHLHAPDTGAVAML